MKFTLYGKVVARTSRKVKKTDGSSYDLYNIVIEEPGQYPSRFQLGSKDASMFGQKDGPCGIGKMVTATGFVNGKAKECKTSEGHKFTTYPVWFTLSSLVPAEAASSAPDDSLAGDSVADDIPF